MKFNFLIGLVSVFLGLLSGESASAQGNFYRIYEGTLLVGSGRIPVQFKVNDKIVEDRFGDPEIPGHGHIENSISISIIEGRLTCEAKVVLGHGELRSCSGLRIRIRNVEDLLSEKTAAGVVSLSSSDAAIGTLEIALKYTQAGDHDGVIDD